MALVEDEERDPFLIEYTKGANCVNVFRSYGWKKLPTIITTTIIDEPEPEEDLVSIATCIQEIALP